MSRKYNRTLHLPWSPGATRDDRVMQDTRGLLGKLLVATEKMDGSNVCLQHDAVFARSHASAPDHPSFNALKSLHASIAYKIPPGLQVFGEWCYARHSIAYDNLPDWLMIFGARDVTVDHEIWWSWSDVGLLAKELDIPRVPQVGLATVPNEQVLKAWVDMCVKIVPSSGPEKEGIVVRHVDSFIDEHFDRCVAKWVRENHVTTDDHWKHQVVIVNGRR